MRSMSAFPDVMRAGSTLVLAALIGCARPAPAPLANAVPPRPPPRDDLCRVLDTIVSAAYVNFVTIDPDHDRVSGAFDSSVKPAGAARAHFVPCCASMSAEGGPWTWVTEWPGADFARMRDRVQACPIMRRLGRPDEDLHTANVIRWKNLAMRVEVRLVGDDSEVSLSVGQEY